MIVAIEQPHLDRRSGWIGLDARDGLVDGCRLGLLAEGKAALLDGGDEAAARGILGDHLSGAPERLRIAGDDGPGLVPRDAAGHIHVERDDGSLGLSLTLVVVEADVVDGRDT